MDLPAWLNWRAEEDPGHQQTRIAIDPDDIEPDSVVHTFLTSAEDGMMDKLTINVYDSPLSHCLDELFAGDDRAMCADLIRNLAAGNADTMYDPAKITTTVDNINSGQSGVAVTNNYCTPNYLDLVCSESDIIMDANGK